MAVNLGAGIYALELGEGSGTFYPSLLWNEQDGATLLDTGMIGTFEQLEEAALETGVPWNDIRRIILTHQDIDHIGNLPAVIASLPSAPEVWAHAGDAPVIEGKQPMLKMTPERFASLPEEEQQKINRLYAGLAAVKVNRVLEDGEELPLQGHIRVIHTPGHTPGHLCFYMADAQLLFAADQLRVVNGELAGPNERMTPDMPLALSSLSRLKGLQLQKILCYHGGLYTVQPEEALKELIQSSK